MKRRTRTTMTVLLGLALAACGGQAPGGAEEPDDGEGNAAARELALREGVEMRIFEVSGTDFNKDPWGAACVKLTETYGGRVFPGTFAKLCFNVDLGWQWSEKGPIPGKTCVNFAEPDDWFSSHWADNYLCYGGKLPGIAEQLVLRWSHQGPYPSMSCTKVECGHCDPDAAWADNYLCQASAPGKQLHRELGGKDGWLGDGVGPKAPTMAADGVGSVRQFQNGAIYWHPDLGAFDLPRASWDRWVKLGGAQGPAGFPVARSEVVGKARCNHFQGGDICAVPGGQAHYLHGPVLERYQELGWGPDDGVYPVSDVTPVGGNGERAAFSGGAALYHLAGKGTFIVSGWILEAYDGSGGPDGPLGWPVADQTGSLKSYPVQRFENGEIVCFKTACRALYEPFYGGWVKLGGLAKTGYPETPLIELEALPGEVSLVAYFENGPVFYSTSGGLELPAPKGMVEVGEEVDLPIHLTSYAAAASYEPASPAWCNGTGGYVYRHGAAFFNVPTDQVTLDYGGGNAIFNVHSGCAAAAQAVSRPVDGQNTYTPLARVTGKISHLKPAYVRGSIDLESESSQTESARLVLQLRDRHGKWVDAVVDAVSVPPGDQFHELESWVPGSSEVRFELRALNRTASWNIRVASARLFGARCFASFGSSDPCFVPPAPGGN